MEGAITEILDALVCWQHLLVPVFMPIYLAMLELLVEQEGTLLIAVCIYLLLEKYSDVVKL